MSDMGCFLPRTVWFWDDSHGICDVLLELEGHDSMDGRAGQGHVVDVHIMFIIIMYIMTIISIS